MEDTKLGALSHLYRIRVNEKGFTLRSFIAYIYIYCQTFLFLNACLISSILRLHPIQTFCSFNLQTPIHLLIFYRCFSNFPWLYLYQALGRLDYRHIYIVSGTMIRSSTRMFCYRPDRYMLFSLYTLKWFSFLTGTLCILLFRSYLDVRAVVLCRIWACIRKHLLV